MEESYVYMEHCSVVAGRILIEVEIFLLHSREFFCQYKIMKKIWVLSFLLFSFKQVVRAGRTKRGP
jgi:hypothetical protein